MTEVDVVALGAALREHRKRRGMTQRELAELTGVSVRTVRHIEQGHVQRPRPESVRRLVAVVGAVRPLGIDVLGPLVVHRGDEMVTIGSVQQRCLLGLLALHANKVVSQSEIVEVLWGHLPPVTYRELLHAIVSRLRNTLRDKLIQTRNAGYLLDVDPAAVDLCRFTELAANEAFADALSCWRGPVLADLPEAVRHHPSAIAVHQQRIATAMTFADRAIAETSYGDVVTWLSELAEVEPLHEGLHARLIVALAGTGRQADALGMFHQIRDRLDQDLGLLPGDELVQAHESVLRQEIPGVRRVLAAPAQLPADVAGFTGRARELAELDEEHPVTVIAGTGGVGKTTMAVHWAHRVKQDFPDGQLYADLRGYDMGEPVGTISVLGGFLRSLGVPGRDIPRDCGERAALLRTLLDGRRMLIVLDNANAADQVRPLLPGTPTVVVVVTSRNSLRGLTIRDGARRIELDALRPEEAFALLRSLIGARVEREPAAARALAEGCSRLPLALRLAADLVVSHPQATLETLVRELDEQSRLDALDSGDDPYSAVRSVFSWSYRALDPLCARVFALLGLAPGPDISRPAISALTGVPEAGIRLVVRQLGNAHLVNRSGDRYWMHSLIRLYAAEQAGKQSSTEDALRRLVDYYLHTALIGDLTIQPHRPPIALIPTVDVSFTEQEALDWFETEYDCLVAALGLAVERNWHTQVWQLCWVLTSHHWRQGLVHDELAAWRAGVAAARALGDPTVEALALRRLGSTFVKAGATTEGLGHLHEALELASTVVDSDDVPHTWLALANAYAAKKNHERAVEYGLKSLHHYEHNGRAVWEATARNLLGLQYAYLSDYETAREHTERALAISRESGHTEGEAMSLHTLGFAAQEAGDTDTAIAYYQVAIPMLESLRYCGRVAEILEHLGHAHRSAGRNAEANVAWRDALRAYEDQGRVTDVQRVLRHLDS